MAYPTTLDTFVDKVDNTDVIYANDVNELQTAIESLEAKVGADSSAVTSSHDYKLSGVTGSDKALKSGTSTQSVTGLTLVTPKITVGSDAVGDLHYVSNVDGTLSRLAKGTDNQILKMNGTSLNWEAETVTVAATESVEGISRLATSAQITAGTASEAGYPLVITPDQLAGSSPTLDGLYITSVLRPVVASNNVKLSADTERNSVVGTSPVFVKSIQVNNPGNVRVSVDLKATSGSVSWYLFRQGVSPVAANILASGSTSSTTYVTTTADVYVCAGDKLDLYYLNSVGGVQAYVKNFRISYDISTYVAGSVITD